MDRETTRRALVVVDRSPGTQRAVIVTAALARDCRAEVIVCRARTVRPSRAGPIESEATTAAQLLVDEAGDALESLGATVVGRLVVTSWGSPAESIVQAALDDGVSIIVIANSGWPGLRSRLSGRSVQRLLAVSDIPVLVVGSDRPWPGHFHRRHRHDAREARHA